MLVQDTLTGALHEVPEYGEAPELGYYGEAIDPLGEVYDGFGNPVGLPFLAPLASALAPLAAKVLPQVASSVLPGISKALPGISQLVGRLLPGGAAPAAPPIPALPSIPGLPLPFGRLPFPAFRPPVPPGWMRPPVPYQGLAPHRRYMRCVMWPGPPGLVPVSAAQAQPQPTAAIVAAATAPLRRRHHFRRRR